MTRYPEQFDDDTNLYTVYDSVKTPLGRDYYPGNQVIYAEGDVSNFPAQGIITLIDNCSTASERAVSFKYTRRSGNEFSGLTLTPESKDVHKPRKITTITLQVRAEHQNGVKDAIIAIEEVIGKRHDPATAKSVFGRINALKAVLYTPKAWFVASQVNGFAPLTVTFKSSSSGMTGPVGDVTYDWDFGDGTTLTSYSPNIPYSYYKPGKYTVSLKVKNMYGEDTVVFQDMIKVLSEAPKAAQIIAKQGAKTTAAGIRTPINQLVSLEVTDNGEQDDKISSYHWSLNDDLVHPNSKQTKASYSVGGLYDVILRTDTEHGAYRITTYDDFIDVVENTNLWFWTYDNGVNVHEFGLLSESFKKASGKTEPIAIDDSFIPSKNVQMRKEFWSNNNAVGLTTSSGQGGSALLCWATGRKPIDPVGNERIAFLEFNGFAGTYKTPCDPVARPWNWTSFGIGSSLYFYLGEPLQPRIPASSATNQIKTAVNTTTYAAANEAFPLSSYANGAHELTQNPVSFDKTGDPLYGHYSSYRSTVKNNTAYIARRNRAGVFQQFYKTMGTMGNPFLQIAKLVDVPTNTFADAALTSLDDGIYLFGNNENYFVYNYVSESWQAGAANPWNSRLFKNLVEESMFAASDGGRQAYLSFDSAFVKFNQLEASFKVLPVKPSGRQWNMMIY